MITDQAYMLLALGVAFGLGLMAIVHAVLQWDGQRRIADEMREQAAERRPAIRAATAHPARPARRPRPSAAEQAREQLEHRAAPQWSPGPAVDKGRRARPPASATGELPSWDGNGQRSDPWGPVPADQLPSYQRPYAPTGQY